MPMGKATPTSSGWEMSTARSRYATTVHSCCQRKIARVTHHCLVLFVLPGLLALADAARDADEPTGESVPPMFLIRPSRASRAAPLESVAALPADPRLLRPSTLPLISMSSSQRGRGACRSWRAKYSSFACFGLPSTARIALSAIGRSSSISPSDSSSKTSQASLSIRTPADGPLGATRPVEMTGAGIVHRALKSTVSK